MLRNFKVFVAVGWALPTISFAIAERFWWAMPSLFERSLKGLQVGDKDLELPGTEDPDISEQLELVEEFWGEYKSVLSKIISGDSNTVPQETLVKATKMNLPLLREMNKAVKMYEESVK
jgi:hypothetical protein